MSSLIYLKEFERLHLRAVMNNKRDQRQNVMKAGTILLGGSGIDCLVRNISDSGGNLEVESQIGIPNWLSTQSTAITIVMLSGERRVGSVSRSIRKKPPLMFQRRLFQLTW